MNAPSKIPAVEIALRTDPGRDPDKQVNEDSSVTKETALGLLAVVCDGMGGHAGGKEASELAVQTIVEIIEAAPAATAPGVALKRAIEEANARIWSMPTAEAGFRPGSTVVAMLAHDAGAEIAHVGDSRLYLVHAGAISQVTKDHSMVQEMVDRNLIRAEDAAKHPDANKILRALGIGKEVDVDLRPEPLVYAAGDVMVLCSDGLSDLVEPAEILQIAGSHPPAQAAGQLVDLANARGGHDNITAMVVRMKSGATARDQPTLLKTMPLTAHVPPVEQGRTGTVVSAPIAPYPSAPAPIPAPPPSPAGPPPPASSRQPRPGTAVAGGPMESPPSVGIPPAPSRPRASEPGRSRTPMLVIGIILALVAVAIAFAIVVVTTRSKHRTVPFVDNRMHDASVAPDDDSTAQEVPVAPAPTLSADPKHVHLTHRDGGAVDPCVGARRAREHDASAQTVERLEERCRNAGGTP
jgi:protein phosphatase